MSNKIPISEPTYTGMIDFDTGSGVITYLHVDKYFYNSDLPEQIKIIEFWLDSAKKMKKGEYK